MCFLSFSCPLCKVRKILRPNIGFLNSWISCNNVTRSHARLIFVMAIPLLKWPSLYWNRALANTMGINALATTIILARYDTWAPVSHGGNFLLCHPVVVQRCIWQSYFMHVSCSGDGWTGRNEDSSRWVTCVCCMVSKRLTIIILRWMCFLCMFVIQTDTCWRACYNAAQIKQHTIKLNDTLFQQNLVPDGVRFEPIHIC